MNKWIKFIPLILLIGYFITYDVFNQVSQPTPTEQTTNNQ
ncbi:hypothetical protein PAQU9191_01622 [Photobacterium aquimaris]|uniref:Uncharacterized protein n=3 Tax=Photobacterium TaxID=657 RepID=A0A1Y6KW94_9GAMM|nr:hypothetical protein PAQU9191_01622 [Photobacterium aquimaris]SMY34361.1 hypothetical protein PMAL9190_01630 [Photobacterium malacitanum]SMY35107.1 hypothetical protein PAND9192_01775 [Photobacterium andalusiense]